MDSEQQAGKSDMDDATLPPSILAISGIVMAAMIGAAHDVTMKEAGKQCRICNQHKPADAYRGTRSACRECERARRREWYAAQAVKPYQRPEMKAYYRQWYAAHAESVKARAAQWTKANHGKRRDVCRENMARQRAKLNDAYVRRMLAQEMGLRCKDIPQPLVEAQRELLKIKRCIREHSI